MISNIQTTNTNLRDSWIHFAAKMDQYKTYASSPNKKAYSYADHTVSSLVLAVTTHRGTARLSWSPISSNWNQLPVKLDSIGHNEVSLVAWR